MIHTAFNSIDLNPYKNIIHRFNIQTTQSMIQDTAIVSSKIKPSPQGERYIFLIQKKANGKLEKIILGYCTDDCIIGIVNNHIIEYHKTSDLCVARLDPLSRISSPLNKSKLLLNWDVNIGGRHTQTILIEYKGTVTLYQAKQPPSRGVISITLGKYSDWKPYIQDLDFALFPWKKEDMKKEIEEHEPVEIEEEARAYEGARVYATATTGTWGNYVREL